MPLPLIASYGSLHCQQHGLTIERAGKPLLVLHQVAVAADDGTLLAANMQATQVGTATLHAVFATAQPSVMLTLDAEATPTGFVLAWNVSGPVLTSELALTFALQPGQHWYGMGERVTQSWPLAATAIISDPFVPTDHGADGTLNLCTPLWLCSTGVAILVAEDTGELAVTLNRDGDGAFQLIQRLPVGLADNRGLPRLVLHILVAEHLPAVQQTALHFLGHPTSAPPLDLFVQPTWTTWARYKTDITQAQVLQLADEIVSHAYPYGILEIDDRWQVAYGALTFDPVKFPDPAALVAALHARGFRVTLWVHPFFAVEAEAFRTAAAQGYLLRDITTGEPVVTRWWQGRAGLLDVGNPAALDWWLAGLQRLQTLYGIDGFKFDGGESNFVPRAACAVGQMTPTAYPDHYVAFVARHFQWAEVRTGWRSQRHGLLFREWDKWSRWGHDNGLHAVLTQALTMGLIGYPFVLPDMIGGNAYHGEVPAAELMIRWTQLTALLPAMQFSLAPWDYGAEALTLCRRYATLHTDLGPVLAQCIAEVCASGTPMVRPLFWHWPDDPVTYTIDDQFLLGAELLVAPILHAGQRQRAIYLPPGTWRDYWTGAIYPGSQWLDAYPAPLETLPLFALL